jgi:electron transfer flavoprotein beta subunit
MKIAVCISHVPDTTTKVIIGADGKKIDEKGVTYIINPYDEYAVEEGLRLKEKAGGEVIAISLGSDSSKETIRKAFAMGADKGILIKDTNEQDSLSTAQSLALVLKDLSPDIILFGKQSIDYDSSQIGVLVAEILGYSSVTIVTKLEITGSNATCEREIEGGKEIVEASLPLVITAQKGLNEPRYPNLKGIMAAKSKPIQEITNSQKEKSTNIIKMFKPVSKASGRIIASDANAGKELVKVLHDEIKII